jgi:hypothetical protein
MSELELWDLITRTMEENLSVLRADANRAASLSARHPPDHQHQESWRKAILREETQEARYEAAIRSRGIERPV